MDLPELEVGFVWAMRSTGRWAACLFTQDVDCIVEISEDGKTLLLSTGVAPLSVVEAVIKANFPEE